MNIASQGTDCVMAMYSLQTMAFIKKEGNNLGNVHGLVSGVAILAKVDEIIWVAHALNLFYCGMSHTSFSRSAMPHLTT